MAERQTERPIHTEKPTEAEGLPLEFLEAQDGGLLPDRIEMRRRRRRRRSSGNTLTNGCSGLLCGGIDVDVSL